MTKYLLLFFTLFFFADFANAGIGCVGSDVTGNITCAIDGGLSLVKPLAAGLVAIAAVFLGISVITSALSK